MLVVQFTVKVFSIVSNAAATNSCSHNLYFITSEFASYWDFSVLSPVSNPCGVDKGGCEQICVLSHRSDNGGLGYRCKCRIGYDLHADGKRCLGNGTFS